MAKKVLKSVSINSSDRTKINDNFTELYATSGATTTSSAAELNFNDGSVAGTVVASKTVVVDANKDIGDFRNLDAVNIDAGASGTAGTVDIFPATASKGKLIISVADQTGDTTVTLKPAAMGQATQVNIADPGAAASYVVQSTAAVTLAEADVLDGATIGSAVGSKVVVLDTNKDHSGIRNLTLGTNGASGVVGNVILSDGQNPGYKATVKTDAQSADLTVHIPDPGAIADSYVAMSTAALTAAEVDVLDGATAGTQVASKAVVADTNVNIGISKVTELHIGASGSEVQVSATAAEINQIADVSTRMVAVGVTGNVATTSEGRIIRVGQDGAANTAITLTLPEATGSGAIYKFIVNTTNTGGLVIAALTTDTMVGIVNILDLDAAAQGAYQASSTDDKITLNSTTTGGQIGDWLEFTDYVDTIWAVKGSLTVPTGSNPADPFSAT